MPAKLTQEQFIKKAREKHGDFYDYSKVNYVNTNTKVAIICPIHGVFYQTPHNHLKGRNCPKCSGHVRNNTKSFIEKARKVHGDKYDYSKVKFTRNKDKVCIICPKHGAFWQEANSHLQGHGCPACYNADVRGKTSIPQRLQHIAETTMRHYGVTNSLASEAVRRKAYETQKNNHTFNSSKSEEKLYKMLTKHFGVTDVIRQYNDCPDYPWLCDFYIKSRDMFIELNAGWQHGDHWFNKDSVSDQNIILDWRNKGKRSYDDAITTWTKRDVIKRKAAKDAGLNYIVFWLKDLSDAEEWFKVGAPDAKDYLFEYSWK